MAQDSATIEIPPPGPELCGGQQWEVGFANLVRDITFTIDVEESIQRAADATGCVNLSIFDNELDGATALANADNMITLGTQGVIEFQTDEKFGLVIMDKFRAENIPVVAIDIPLPGATFFGADNYRAGFMAGEGMGHAFKERYPTPTRCCSWASSRSRALSRPHASPASSRVSAASTLSSTTRPRSCASTARTRSRSRARRCLT